MYYVFHDFFKYIFEHVKYMCIVIQINVYFALHYK
jgi:hypothetical protein